MNRPEDPDDDGIVRWSDEDDADITDRVRDTLSREAERVEVNDRWTEVSAAARATRRRRPWAIVAAAAVALVVGVGLGGLFLQDRITAGPAAPPPTTVNSPSATPDRSTSAPPPSPDPTRSSSASSSATATATKNPTPDDPTSSKSSEAPADPDPISGVSIFFLGDSKSSTWLYREFHTVPGGADRVTAAVNAQLSTAPLDDDYTNPWHPGTDSAEVTREGDDLTVDIPGDAFDNDVDAETADLAVQQLVWTATAAAETRGDVTITVDGKPYEAWGSVALGEPMGRDSEARSPIWITDPAEGQTDQAGTVTVLGSSTSFEGNVQWKITEAGSDEVVVDGFTTGGSMGEYADFDFSIQLEPGRYTVTVYAEDQSDGESAEGPAMFPDTKTWTVE